MNRTGCWIALTGLLFWTAASVWALPPAEKLFPETTRGFLSVRDVADLREHFEQTQIGQLVKDPALKPFIEDLRLQIQDRLLGSQEELGISLDDVTGLATGEVAVGLVFADDAERPSLAASIAIKGKAENAQQLVDRIAEEVNKQKGSVTKTTINGKEVWALKLPKSSELGRDREFFYYRDDEVLLAASNQATLTFMLGQLQNPERTALADVPAYREIAKRCDEDAGENKPHIQWFIEPFGYGAAIRASIPPEQRRRQRQWAESLKKAGFSVLQGLGGSVSFASEGYELVHRTFIYAPGPFEKSAKILSFPNHDEFEPPAFVPRDVATLSIGYCNILQGFDSIGPLFDQTVGEGEEGVWDDVLASLKEDPNGPQIDLRNEFFAHFGEKVNIVSAYQLPITTTSERMLIAIEVKDEKSAAQGLDKMFQYEERFRKREYKGRTIWEGLPEEKPKVPQIELGGVPGVGRSEVEEEAKEPLFPNASLTVDRGYLLIASHYDYLTQILDLEDERESIKRNPAFLEVMEAIDKAGGKTACWRFFSMTDEEYRATYELIRQGKMPESETMLARVLNAILAPPEKGTLRKQRIDGSKLPDYEIVRRHLGPAGFFAISEDDGWFLKGFTLPKK
ncbi:MAG: hypothetical protein ACUVTH_03710 [Thermogutta sp.]